VLNNLQGFAPRSTWLISVTVDTAHFVPNMRPQW